MQPWFYELWKLLPNMVAALATTMLALGCFIQLRVPARRWFAFGATGFFLWTIGFACAELGELSIFFESEKIAYYTHCAFLFGGIALCVFGISYLSYHVTISTKPSTDFAAEQLHRGGDQ